MVQDIWLCHTPRLAEGTCIKCPLFFFAQNSPERVAHESPEESGIARSSFKAESNKGPAIPNGIDLADHLGSDVKKIARKDGDPAVRGTVPPTLKTKLKGNKKKDHLNSGNFAPDHWQSIFTEELLDDTLNPLDPCEQCWNEERGVQCPRFL